MTKQAAAASLRPQTSHATNDGVIEPYASLAVEARETSRIRIGPLVSPVTFRSPVDVGRAAAHLDLLSGGRFALGVGAGWHEPEHQAYGIPFPPPGERADRLEEAIQVMRAMWGPGPASFAGRYYRLEDVDFMPKPAPGRPWLIVGGSGPKRTLPIAARYADEWNSVSKAPAVYAGLKSSLACGTSKTATPAMA